MDFSRLKRGCRYLFQKEINGRTEYFRATFLGVHISNRGVEGSPNFHKHVTLVVTDYDTKNNYESSYVFTPRNSKSICFITYTKYITNAFTLIDLMKNENTKLPDDVLYEINKFY
jgi:hypothetical protein